MQFDRVQLFRNTSSFFFLLSPPFLLLHFLHLHLSTKYKFQQVNKAQSLSFTLTNQRSEISEVSFHFINTSDPHSCLFEPSSCFSHFLPRNHFFFAVSLTKGMEKKITLQLTMSCTSRLSTNVVIISKEIGCCFVPLHAESSPSSFLSLEEVQLGKTLGKGTYQSFNCSNCSFLFLFLSFSFFF